MSLVKIVRDRTYYYQMLNEYYAESALQGKINWNDFRFQHKFRIWAKTKYDVLVDDSGMLAFKSDQDFTIFLLKINQRP